MIHVAIVSGDAPICQPFKQLLSQKTVDLICEEGVETIADVNKEIIKAEYIFIDIHLLQEIPLQVWKSHFTKQKLIAITPFAKQSEALLLLEQGVKGVFTKAIDNRKWEAVIYHPEKTPTTVEQYFLRRIIPLLLQWEAEPSPSEKNPLALEAEVIHLLDSGQTVSSIASILKVDEEIIQQYVAVIQEIRSA